MLCIKESAKSNKQLAGVLFPISYFLVSIACEGAKR